MVRVLASVVFVLAVLAYAAPSVIAILKANRRWPMIVAIDILLGWTILGWMVSLAMALQFRLPKRRRKIRVRPAEPAASFASNRASGEPLSGREPVEPAAVRDDSYAGWLEGGAAMKA